jgi:hypothetical protein
MLTGAKAGGAPQRFGFRAPRLVLLAQPFELAAMDADEVIVSHARVYPKRRDPP